MLVTNTQMMEKVINWRVDDVYNIFPEEFYSLIDRNRDHICNTFPVTLSNCIDAEKTKSAIAQSATNQENKENHYFYLRDVDSNMLIGYIVVKNINLSVSKCELAYFIDKDFQGRGIITKAVGDAISFCFEELNMNKVFICTSLINTASQKIALKNGFAHEGIMRQEFKNGHGILEDIMYFGLLRSDHER